MKIKKGMIATFAAGGTGLMECTEPADSRGMVTVKSYGDRDGQILVEFPLSGENHSQVAPYPASMVRKRHNADMSLREAIPSAK